MNAEPAPRWPWLRGWRLIASATTMALLFAFVAVAMWFRNDADLRAVEAEARALGVPERWADVPGRALADPERIACCGRVAALVKGKTTYGVERLLPKHATWPPVPRAGDPLPDELIAYYRDQDQEWLVRLDEEVDRLGSERLVLRVEDSFMTGAPWASERRATAGILAERAILAGPGEAARRAIERALGFTLAWDRSMMIHSIAADYSAQAVLRSLAYRLEDVRAGDSRSIRALLRRCVEGWREDLRVAVIGDYLGVKETVNDRTWQAMGTGNDLASRFYLRVGRAPALRQQLDGIAALMARDSLGEAIAWSRAYRVEPATRWTPGRKLAAMFDPKYEELVAAAAGRVIRAEVMLAELEHGETPSDPFDPAGGPLRTLRRADGAVGWYSVGRDGIDDGGDMKKDLGIVLGRAVAPGP